MAKYLVWVSHPQNPDRIDLHEGDDSDKAADLVYSLVRNSGDAVFDVGISIGETSAPLPVIPPVVPPPVTPPQTAPVVHQGGRRRTQGLGQA